jgi:hypothetical protein
MLCSDCFRNEGLRLEAEKVGLKDSKPCPECGKTTGAKLDEEKLGDLVDRFFKEGSRTWEDRTPRFRSNYTHSPVPLDFDQWLDEDGKKIQEEHDLARFRASARRLGHTALYKEIKAVIEDRTATVALATRLEAPFSKIFGTANSSLVYRGTKLYRVRTDPPSVTKPTDFDSPPDSIRREPGRFDRLGFPVFYGAFDVDTCLYERGVQAGQEIVLATLKAVRDIPVLDLDMVVGPPSFSPPDKGLIDMAYYLKARLSSKEKEDYEVLRHFAEFLRSQDQSGIQYGSFYREVSKNKSAMNIAIFGFPIAEGMLELLSVNRIRLSTVSFDYYLGPLSEELWNPSS